MNILSRLAALSPFPYYINHLIMAAAISAVFWQPMAGALFYIGREVAQREANGRWDWPGLLWPVVPLAAIEAFLRLY